MKDFFLVDVLKGSENAGDQKFRLVLGELTEVGDFVSKISSWQ